MTGPLADAPTPTGPPATRLARRWAALGWLVIAVLLSAGIFTEHATRSGPDDPKPARQRSGVLAPAARAPRAIPVSDELAATGRRAAILFIRPKQYDQMFLVLGPQPLPADVDGALVVPAKPQSKLVPTPIACDADGTLARAYRMPRPRDGGPPVGYALVDSAGRVRYSTLVPGVADHVREVRTMLSGLR